MTASLIGFGRDSLLGTPKGRAIVVTKSELAVDRFGASDEAQKIGNSAPARPDGIRADLDYREITNSTSLRQFLGISASLSVGFLVGSFEARLNYSKSTSFDSRTMILGFKVSAKNARIYLRDVALEPCASALLAGATGPRDFFLTYGDQYISGVTTGGDLIVLYEYSFKDEQQRESFRLGISGKGIGFSAAFEYASGSEAQNTSESVHVAIFHAGSRLGGPSEDLTNPQVLRTIFNGFEQRIDSADKDGRPVILDYEYASYRTVPCLPVSPHSLVDLSYARQVVERHAAVEDAMRVEMADLQNRLRELTEEEPQRKPISDAVDSVFADMATIAEGRSRYEFDPVHLSNEAKVPGYLPDFEKKYLALKPGKIPSGTVPTRGAGTFEWTKIIDVHLRPEEGFPALGFPRLVADVDAPTLLLVATAGSGTGTHIEVSAVVPETGDRVTARIGASGGGPVTATKVGRLTNVKRGQEFTVNFEKPAPTFYNADWKAPLQVSVVGAHEKK